MALLAYSCLHQSGRMPVLNVHLARPFEATTNGALPSMNAACILLKKPSMPPHGNLARPSERHQSFACPACLDTHSVASEPGRLPVCMCADLTAGPAIGSSEPEHGPAHGTYGSAIYTISDDCQSDNGQEGSSPMLQDSHQVSNLPFCTDSCPHPDRGCMTQDSPNFPRPTPSCCLCNHANSLREAH